MKNAKVKDEIVIRKMSDLIDCCGREDFPMKVITNNAGVFGASYSFTKEGAKYLSDYFGEDMFIIPSSVHELIAVPYCDGEQARYNEIIRHVNKTELAEGEFLSDHVYVLDHKEKTIRM